MSKRFQPGVPLTLCTGLALLILMWLGTWQVSKVGPKTALLEVMHNNLAAVPITLPVQLHDAFDMQYRHVSFTGVRMADPVRVFGTNRDGGAGYYLYAPVRRTDVGQETAVILVNFGWIPMQDVSVADLPAEDTIYSGVVMANAVAGSMTPENNPVADLWYIADIPSLAGHFGLDMEAVYPIRVFADHRGAPAGLPRGGQVRVDIPNNHFQYALTWYGLAVGLVGVYVAFGLKRAREQA